tara:strand:+ start:10729 stop:13122 length:2394 start_codon:yes stop_codon:yes gene_type:complete
MSEISKQDLYNAATSNNAEQLENMMESLTTQDLPSTIEFLKRKGNGELKLGYYREAIQSYNEALQGAMKIRSFDDAKHLYSNISLAHYKMDDFVSARNIAMECIKVDETWAKGYYRLGIATLAENKLQEAYTLFNKVLELSPNNKDATTKLNVCLNALENKDTDTLVDHTINYDPVLIQQEVDSYDETTIAKQFHRLMLGYSDLSVTTNQIIDADDIRVDKEFTVNFWKELLTDKSVAYGTCLGRLPSLTHCTGVERFPTLANLIYTVYEKHCKLTEQEMIGKIVCNKYDKMEESNIGFKPSNIVFTEWDYTCLGTGWLSAKENAEQNLLSNNDTFFPQEIKVWAQLVYANSFENNWSPIVEKAPDNLEFISNKVEFTVSKPVEMDLCFSVLPNAKTTTCCGLIYGYSITNGQHTIIPSADTAFVTLDSFEAFTNQETEKILHLSVQKGRFVFGTNKIKRSDYPFPAKTHNSITNKIKNDAYRQALSYHKKSTETFFDPVCGVGVLCQLMEDELPQANIQGCDYHQGVVDFAKKKLKRSKLISGDVMTWLNTLPSNKTAVFELFDVGLIGEGLLHLLPSLRENSKLLPLSATINAQLVEARFTSLNEVDLTACNTYRWEQSYTTAKHKDWKPVTDPVEIGVIDFATATPEKHDFGKFEMKITNNGVASAVIFWFVLDLGNGVKLDSRDAYWGSALQYLPEYTVTTEDTLTLQSSHDGSVIQFGLNPGENPVDTPRFDPKFTSKRQQLDLQTQELFNEVKSNLKQKYEAWQGALGLCSSAGRFNIEPSVANKFLLNLF